MLTGSSAIPEIEQTREHESARAKLVLLGDLNLAEFIRHMARYGGTLIEEDGLLLFAGEHAHPGPYRNGAIRMDGSLGAHETLERVAEFFKERKRSYVLWVRAHADSDLDVAARLAGLELLETEGLPELCSEVAPELASVPEGVELRRVESAEDRRDFVLVNSEGWGMPGLPIDLASAMFFRPDILDVPFATAYLAYVDGRPAASAMALNSHGATGGYWGATVEWARRRGLHDLCVRASFREAFELGARVAVCQTSQMAAGNMERMGFRQMTRYFRFVGRTAKTMWE